MATGGCGGGGGGGGNNTITTKFHHSPGPMLNTNIVAEWLRSLHLAQYAESFIDNGYDDLEICKQVGEPDLDAIGVFHPGHRARLLHSVRTLREEGAASVYFTLEEGNELQCLCGDSGGSSSTTSVLDEDAIHVHHNGSQKCALSTSLDGTETKSSAGSVESSVVTHSHDLAMKFHIDEYEEGKAELVRIPKIQLKALLKEKLAEDGIRLSCQPYSKTDGERGYLDGLASRYADLFSTHYGDVLAHLEDLRKIEWSGLTTKERGYGASGHTSSTAYNNSNTSTTSTSCSSSTGGIPMSHSQPIYVPGRYLPSSCLSDKEEDEIYGFGYGVFGAQMVRHQRHIAQNQATSQHPLLMQPHQNYQTCLSPRSAYFYEFPPNDPNYTNTGKKRTTFSRFLRGLKTSHRKEKHHHGTNSPRHGRAAMRGVPQRVDTPDSVLQSGLALNDLGQHTILRSMVDPRDYDRLRHLQMNGNTPNTFEETIYRLKVQEVLKKREKFSKDHEEILRDIKQGLLQLGKEGIRGPLSADDTYMYDEEVRMLAPTLHPRGHWYDEPPYESDPEDFLMGASPANGTGGGGTGPTATIQNGRVCFTLNLRAQDQGRSDSQIISLRSAGDISLARDPTCDSIETPEKEYGGTPRRGLILPPQAGYPPTIIPLRSSRDRGESGDYAGSDVQSITSRLSNLSVDTDQYYGMEHVAMDNSLGLGVGMMGSASATEGRIRHFRKTNVPRYCRSEDGLSPCQSSDYDDTDDFNNKSQQVATVHVSATDNCKAVPSPAPTSVSGGFAEKVRVLREDVQKKINKLKGETCLKQQSHHFSTHPYSGHHGGEQQTFPCSTSSVESLPSGSGSSTQALVRPGSNHSSISPEECCTTMEQQSGIDATQKTPELIVAKAKALIDHTPSPFDKESLKYKKGDVIDVTWMDGNGLQGHGICRGRRGTLKLGNVELIMSGSRSQKDSNGICPSNPSTTSIINSATGSLNTGAGIWPKARREVKWQRNNKTPSRPASIEELLLKIGLPEYTSIFTRNGYEDLSLFKEIEPSDLDYLGIMHNDHRSKLLAAVQLLHHFDSGSDDADFAGSSSDPDDIRNRNVGPASSPFSRPHFSRDSGCFEASSKLGGQNSESLPLSDLAGAGSRALSPSASNNLDAVVEQCNNEMLARIRRQQQQQQQQHQGTVINGSISASLTSNGSSSKSSTIGEEECASRSKLSLKDSYVSMRGHTSLVDPCRRTAPTPTPRLTRAATIDSGGAACEVDHKLTQVKFVAGCAPSLNGGGCLSEKSSDSGISSSSLSSSGRDVVHFKQCHSSGRRSPLIPPSHINDQPLMHSHKNDKSINLNGTNTNNQQHAVNSTASA